MYIYIYIYNIRKCDEEPSSRAIDKVRVRENREIKIRRERGNGTQWCGEQSSTLVQS